MVDEAKVRSIFTRLERYTAHLHELAGEPKETFLTNFRSIGSAKYYLQIAVECCIDACNHIIARKGWRAPDNYSDSFVILAEQGVIPESFLPTARAMVGFRNRIVHLYWEITDAKVYEILQTDLGDFDRFADWITSFVAGETGGERHALP